MSGRIVGKLGSSVTLNRDSQSYVFAQHVYYLKQQACRIPSRLALELHCGYSKIVFNYLQDNNIFFFPDFMVSQLEVEDDAKMNIYRHLGYFLDHDSIQLT